MENTPFDDPATRFPVQANLPPSRSQRKKKNWLIAIPIILATLVITVFAANYYRRQNELKRREEKLAALRQDIKKVVLEDNALVLEMLDDGALEHITFAEFFTRADKNKEGRDDLIRRLRSTETGPYGEQVGNFIKLMETENEWVRSEEAVSRAGLDVSSKWDVYKDATDQTEKAAGSIDQARRDYIAAPYGEDYDEAAALNYARTRLDSANEGATDAFKSWTDSSDKWKQAKNSAAVEIADWMRLEPIYYPNFAPRREILDLLVKKKADYIGDDSNNNDNSPKTDKQKADEPAPTATASPTNTPMASSPSRVKSTKPLDGERFPETRTEQIDADYAANLSDDDLRYAINEMFARYGMTFKDKGVQANYQDKTWYHPDDKWTPVAIKRSMTPDERSNLVVLVRERNLRRTNADASQ